MQDREPSLIARDDTFFGVCQALGDDFGFNPIWLRAAFAVPLMFMPMTALAVYFGLGVIVLLSRMLAPRPRRAVAAQPAVEQEIQPQVPLSENDADQFALPMAA